MSEISLAAKTAALKTETRRALIERGWVEAKTGALRKQFPRRRPTGGWHGATHLEAAMTRLWPESMAKIEVGTEDRYARLRCGMSPQQIAQAIEDEAARAVADVE